MYDIRLINLPILNLCLRTCLVRIQEVLDYCRYARNYTQMAGNTRISHNRYLIVGLGNHDLPNSRHSIGMALVDKMAAGLDGEWHRERTNCLSVICELKPVIEDVELIVMKPLVPMNINGKSVFRTVRHYGIPTSNVYLVHDDLDRRLGKFSIKEKGSAGGHNGVKSVCSSLGTDDIPRLRLGIGRPTNKNEVVNYVLEEITREQKRQFENLSKDCIKLLLEHIQKRQVKTDSVNTTEENNAEVIDR